MTNSKLVKGMSLAMTKGLNLAIVLADQKGKTYGMSQYSNMDMTMDLCESKRKGSWPWPWVSVRTLQWVWHLNTVAIGLNLSMGLWES